MLSATFSYCYSECHIFLLLRWVSHFLTVSLSAKFSYCYAKCHIFLLLHKVPHFLTVMLSATFSYCYAECHIFLLLCWVPHFLIVMLSATFSYCYAECHIFLLLCYIFIMYSRSVTCCRILNVPDEKDRCTVTISEAKTLSTSFILLISLHFRYVFMLICWSLYRCYLPPFRRSASYSFSLSLSLQ